LTGFSAFSLGFVNRPDYIGVRDGADHSERRVRPDVADPRLLIACEGALERRQESRISRRLVDRVEQ
jgi:hypothetical protein